jgi:DNA-directed RNA polymerase II subunit RPB1
MSLYRELSYDHDFDQIKGIQFCVLSAEEIEKRSVAEIFKTETYNGNVPVHSGLFDPRMGVIDYNQVCVTCEQKNTFCPGHFGHIKLAKPVFYIQFFDTVRRVLKCVCTRCSKLLVDPDSEEIKAILNKKISRQKRWEAIYKICSKKKRCGQDTIDGCGAKVPTITKESMLKIGLEWKDVDSKNNEALVKKQILNAEDTLRILRRISDRDAEIMGFHKKYNRPEWMICTVLPVPPPTVRPSVRNDAGVRQEDDLTHWLQMILKANNQLKAKLEKTGDKPASKEQIDMLTMLLQWEVATMIDNTMPGIPPSNQRTGRPMRSLTERLKSKEGRIRGNLMGKRVDFSARSVITPDPNISIDELGVPIKIAMNLTFPEIVNKYNRSEIMQLVRNGPDVYPGAKTIRKRNGAIYKLKSKHLLNVELEDGDVVDRHLRDGDVVLFNRQPSLHRMSMMCHRVRVMPFNTFRLNVMVTPAYNADFDGDKLCC